MAILYCSTMFGIALLCFTNNIYIKQSFYFLFFSTFVLVIGFRSGIGDYANYIRIFDSLSSDYIIKWNEDPLFFFIAKIIKQYNLIYSIIFLLVATISLVLYSYCIKKYSIERYLTLFLYASSYMINYDMHLMRQGVALSIVQYSYTSILKRKPHIFCLLIFIAAGFHSSALIFLIAYPLSILKIKRIHLFAILALCFAVILHNPINDVLGLLKLNSDRRLMLYLGYTQTKVTIFSFLEKTIVCIFCIIKYNKFKNQPLYCLLTKLYFFAYLIFLCFLQSDVLSSRMSVYFRISEIYLIPILVSKTKNWLRVSIYFIVLIWYFAKNLNVISVLMGH